MNHQLLLTIGLLSSGPVMAADALIDPSMPADGGMTDGAVADGGVALDMDPELDSDGDGQADALDNCPQVANPEQADLDEDGLGNLCDEDDDADQVPDAIDNCPLTANPDQFDHDADGIGAECDPGDDPNAFRGTFGKCFNCPDDDCSSTPGHEPAGPEALLLICVGIALRRRTSA